MKDIKVLVKPNLAFYLIYCSPVQLIKRAFLPLHAKNLCIQSSYGLASLKHTACLLLLENILVFCFSGQLLLKHILKPLILYPSLQPCTEEQSNVFILRFKSEEPSLDHSSPMEVFDKIRLIFEVLHKYLLSR